MDVPSATTIDADRREYVQFRTRFTFDRFVELPRSGRYRFLDFGCGDGYSIEALLEVFPRARIIGTDYDHGLLTRLAAKFGESKRVTILPMTEANSLDVVESGFDVIQLNAVFEHLLPEERRTLMPGLWERLALGGYLVVTETPARWFPIETHSTSLPFVNYLPDRLALAALRHLSRNPFPKSTTWQEALRAGLRGATTREIVASLAAGDGAVRLVNSSAPDARDTLDVWWHGECRQSAQKKLAYRLLSAWRAVTGHVVSPWVNLVVQKVA
jgi:trans-aconitate methyltransferase